MDVDEATAKRNRTSDNSINVGDWGDEYDEDFDWDNEDEEKG